MIKADATRPKPSTAERIVTEAQRLFAARGFGGVSLASISDALGLTKQALIHHFGTKEHLYAAVLHQVSHRCAGSLEVALEPRQGASSEATLTDIVDWYCAYGQAYPQDVALIARGLLDVPDHADQVAHYTLEPLLRRLVKSIQATKKWHDAPEPQALALACQLLGAVSWFVISEPMLTRAFGEGPVAETADIFPGEIRRSVRRLLQD